MDHFQEEDCIAVGSTGTLSALMEKEMEILQARRSCSVSHNHHNMHCKKSLSSPKNLYGNTLHTSYKSVFGPSASPLMSPPSSYANLVTSLWSDLKSLMLRSPTSLHQHSAHTPLICSHSNAALFCQEQQDINYEDYAALLCNESPPLTFTPAYPDKTMPHSAHMRRPFSKETTYPKEKIAAEASPYSSYNPSMDTVYIRKQADCPQWGSPLHYSSSHNRLTAGAPDYPNGRSPLHACLQESSGSAYRNRKNADVYQAIITEYDQEIWKFKAGPTKDRQSVAGASAAKIYPKRKTLDAKSPNVQSPTCPKASFTMGAMRRSDPQVSQNGKVLQENEAIPEGARTSRKSCSRKREERALHDERCCMQKEMGKREEREDLRRREERECTQREGCTPASSPLLRPNRSFGGRVLPLVGVVDLQCCHTPDLSSKRLSFTRLPTF